MLGDAQARRDIAVGVLVGPFYAVGESGAGLEGGLGGWRGDWSRGLGGAGRGGGARGAGTEVRKAGVRSYGGLLRKGKGGIPRIIPV